jgi:hypothetical protein
LIAYALAMLAASVVLGVGFAIRPLSMPPVIREREIEVAWEVPS